MAAAKFTRSGDDRSRTPDLRQRTAAEAPRHSAVGALLSETRESYGWALADVGQALRIKPEYLASLEQGRIDRLPGPTYATGFMRAYAEYLGLDSAEIVRRFQDEQNVRPAETALTFPVPLTERGIPGSSLITLALILSGLFYGGWYWFDTGPHPGPPAVGPVPARLLAPPILDPPTITPDSAAAAEPAPPPTTVAALPAPGPQPAASQPLTPADPHVFGNTAAGKVVVKATADAWVEVLDDDHPIWSRLLKAGDVYNPPKEGLVLRTGNAGGIEIDLDGKALPPFGPSGQVRRIPLDPAKLTG